MNAILIQTTIPQNAVKVDSPVGETLIREAERIFELAEAERKFGTRTFIHRPRLDSRAKTQLDTISEWHLGHALWNYRRVLKKLALARILGIDAKDQRTVEEKFEECRTGTRICKLLLRLPIAEFRGYETQILKPINR